MKQICVIGLGNFGRHFARTLAQMDREVLAIDNNEAAVTDIRDEVHQALIADARDFDTLRAVIPPDIGEVVVSLGDDLAGSILCALHLKKLGVKSIRAKAANDDHAEILRSLGVTEVFFPERETAERMAWRIVRPNLLDFFPLGEDYEVLEIPAPHGFLGKALSEAPIRIRFQALVIAIKKAHTDAALFMPSANYVLTDGDVLVVMGKSADLQRLSEEP